MINVKSKRKLILMVTIPDILITWIITRTLDYITRRLRGKIRFEGDIHVLGRLLQIIDQLMTETYILMFFEDTPSARSYLRILARSPHILDIYVKEPLRLHRQLHKRGILKGKSCQSCQVITENKDFLQKLVSDPKLYPPFKFPEK